MSLTPSDLAAYEKSGYVFVPGLFSEQEIDLLRQEARKILAEGHPGIIVEKDGVTPRTIVNPQTYSSVFQRFVRHPRLVGSAMQLLKSPVYVFQMGLNCKAPFTGDVWWWHQDFPTYFADDGIPSPRMVNCIIFVEEVTEFSGPLMLVPGSQVEDLTVPEKSAKGTSYKARYSDDADVRRLTAQYGLVAPKGPPGCTIFQHTNILHGSTSNMSPWGRTIITLTYNSIHNLPTKQSVRPTYISPDMSPIEPLEDSCLGIQPVGTSPEV
jgi:ectoine hydroxylase